MKWILYISLFLKLITSTLAYADSDSSWPEIKSKTNLASSLTNQNFPKNGNRFEGSGVAYDLVNNKIYLLTTGYLIRMNTNGSGVEKWDIGLEDQESITIRYIKGKQNPLIYIGIEFDDKEQAPLIREFDPDLNNGSYTNKYWNLKNVLTCTQPNKCMEGMTFIPDRFHGCNGGKSSFGSGGVFAVSTQEYGDIKIVDIDLERSGNTNTSCETVETGHTDVSDLSFDAVTKKLYVLFDRDNLMQIYNVEKSISLINEYTLPEFTHDQEGISIIANCNSGTASILIAQDDNGASLNFWRLDGFPIQCSLSDYTIRQKTYLRNMQKISNSSVNDLNLTSPKWALF